MVHVGDAGAAGLRAGASAPQWHCSPGHQALARCQGCTSGALYTHVTMLSTYRGASSGHQLYKAMPLAFRCTQVSDTPFI
ncbi:hypothetical protein HaLaN_21897 [Haematococcus lacustris]|uniref:Uncharacterized protein n=1 Tax=Haematococcus lacustris TaxID=44745 RepID=A0A699ZSK9_HAELA|nr:hypothetical protein HaLaN_21897 [Haematococcus lacustris]